MTSPMTRKLDGDPDSITGVRWLETVRYALQPASRSLAKGFDQRLMLLLCMATGPVRTLILLTLSSASAAVLVTVAATMEW